MAVLDVGPLADAALEAATAFHAAVLPRARALLGGGEGVVLAFLPADHTHCGWRLAAVQGLAREFAPLRVNGVATADPHALAAAVRYLDNAEGVTGQYLPLDSQGAGSVIPSAG